MATVYRAHDPAFDREVAIKVLPREFLHDPTFRERFRHEAKIIASLEHPAIVPVYYFGEEDGQPFIVMRYMAGGSLAERLATGSLPLNEIQRILAALAPALDEAHERGIIHRDLKPGNILFDQRDAPHIGDFGIAKLTATSQGLSISGGIIGTPAYMSPEQALGKPLDGRSDLYALGAILFEMLTGQTPYQADTPMGMAMQHVNEPLPRLASLRPDLPAEAQAILDRAMAKQRDERYATAQEFTQALGAGLAADAVVPPTDVVVPPTDAVVPPTERVGTGAGWAGASPAPTGSPAPADIPTEHLPQKQPIPDLPRPDPRQQSRSFPLGWLLGGILLLGIAALLGRGFLAGGDATPGTGDSGLSQTPSAASTATTEAALALASPSATPAASPTSTVTPEPGPTPGLGSTLLSETDGMTLVFVPAGEFLMGTSAQDAEFHEQPQHPVFLDAFWIDQTEVTNAMYEGCVADGACPPPDPTSSGLRERYFGEPEFANHPVIHVSWDDATAYCAWAGRRLPTEAEWEKAARGTEGQPFPWGEEAATGDRLNFCDGNCPFEYKNGTIDDGFADTAPGGSYEAGASPFGALDMSGNVWEWVNDWYEPDYYANSPASNPPGPELGEGKVLRGGAWEDIVRPVTARGALGTAERMPFLGFRCALSP